MSGKLSTKDIKVGGEGVAKTLEPGNQKCKINSVSLEEFKLKPGALNIILHLEGEDLGSDFQGFFINKDKEELGRHAGKVGNVKLTEWAFADGETKSGIAVSRDREMLKALKQLCTNINCTEWLTKNDEKHDTIESFFKAFAKDKPYKDTFYNFCIAGKEYTNKSGYLSYDMYIPKYSKDGNGIEVLNAPSSKLLVFKESEHIKKKKVENVEQFAAPTSMDTPTDPGITTNNNDFDL
jgi:hypothetical protein